MSEKRKRQLPMAPGKVSKSISSPEIHKEISLQDKPQSGKSTVFGKIKNVSNRDESFSKKKELEKDFHERLREITSATPMPSFLGKIWRGNSEKELPPPLYQLNKYEPVEVLDVTLEYMEKELNDLKSQISRAEQDFAAIREDALNIRNYMDDIQTLKYKK